MRKKNVNHTRSSYLTDSNFSLIHAMYFNVGKFIVLGIEFSTLHLKGNLSTQIPHKNTSTFSHLKF